PQPIRIEAHGVSLPRVGRCAYRSRVAGTVLYELDDRRHVVTITYNRPDVLNAIDGEMRRDLNEAFARFRDDEDAWIAIVTGGGRRVCASRDRRRAYNS